MHTAIETCRIVDSFARRFSRSQRENADTLAVRIAPNLAKCNARVVESCAVCGIGNHAASLAARRDW